jgi:hypothetical protein
MRRPTGSLPFALRADLAESSTSTHVAGLSVGPASVGDCVSSGLEGAADGIPVAGPAMATMLAHTCTDRRALTLRGGGGE